MAGVSEEEGRVGGCDVDIKSRLCTLQKYVSSGVRIRNSSCGEWGACE